MVAKLAKHMDLAMQEDDDGARLDPAPALLPVGYTIGDTFSPAGRPPPETITAFDQWQLS